MRNAHALAAFRAAYVVWVESTYVRYTHIYVCVRVYIYTDIYERDYYRYRFTYIINTRNYCRIFKTAESAPDIRKWLSLSLPSQLVPLVRLVNATCQSPSWGGCWEGAGRVLGRQDGCWEGAGEAGLPVSRTCTLHSAPGRSKASSPACKLSATHRACRYLNPPAREGARGDPSA